MSRLEKLKAMLAEDPADTFLKYAVAMELQGQGEWVPAESAFRDLLTVTPPYIPAWFMLAQLLVRDDRVDEARAILREGIDHARLLKDHHAAGEMGELLASLGALGEDD